MKSTAIHTAFAWVIAIGGTLYGMSAAIADRTVLCLDGEWEIAQGGDATPPEKYEARAPVPGLADMAKPAFEGVGKKSEKRRFF